MMDFTEAMFREIADKVLGTTALTYQGPRTRPGQTV